jgi:tripeptidyl-peptidase I
VQAAVQEWLLSEGIGSSVTSPYGDSIAFTADIHVANVLLGANFNKYTSKTTRRSYIRSESYAIPSTLRDHIEFITTNVPSEAEERKQVATQGIERRAVTTPIVTTCTTTLTAPKCLQSLYGIPTTIASSLGDSNSLGVADINGNVRDSQSVTFILLTP